MAMAKKLWEFLSNGTTLLGLLPAAVVFTVSCGLAWLANLEGVYIFGLGLGFAVLSLVIMKYSSSKTIGWSIIIISSFLAVAAAGVRYQSRQDDYELTFKGPLVDYYQIRSTTLISHVTLGLVFDNPNNFPIYSMHERRHVSIQSRTSGDKQERVEDVIPSKTKDVFISDGVIRLAHPVDFNTPIIANVDFLVCYGREKGVYSKSFIYKGVLISRYDQSTGKPSVSFTANEPTDKNLGPKNECS